MANDSDLRRDRPPAPAGGLGIRLSGPPVRLAALMAVAAAACVALAQLTDWRVGKAEPATPGFLAQALGRPQAAAPLVREPARGVRLAVEADAFRFERDGRAAGLALDGEHGGGWTRFERGASRATSFGRETVVLRGEDGLEQFLTVERRLGRRTWRWRLTGSALEPIRLSDGSIELRAGNGSSGLEIAPVEILDAVGRTVTPAGLRWGLARRSGAWWLELALDDARLPLPYVIDPAITSTAATTATGASGLNPGRPGNVGDLLVAQVLSRGAGAIATPAGWTQIRQSNTTNASQATFWTWGAAGTVTTFTWAGGGNGGAQIVAFANAHPTAPLDASSTNAGTTATATATGVTTTFPSELVVALFGQPTNNAWGLPTGYASLSSVTQSGNPSGRVSLLAAGATQGGAGSTGNVTTAAGGDWVAQLVTIRQAPDDGDGTIAAAPAGVGSSSTGNTVTLTYTAGVQGMAAGAVAVDVPAGWSAPSTTGSAAGYTTASTGTVGVSGQRITVSNVTLAAGATLTITYGSKASGGPGATSSSATGAVAWTALQRGTSAGTLTAIASASVNQFAANGSGTASASPAVVSAGATGTTVTLTYTAATGGMNGGAVSVAVPAGWSAPSTTNGNAGYTTASTGTVGVSGQTVTITGVTLAAGATLTITYGTGSGPGATSSATPGTQTWQVQQRSTASGTLTAIGASPQVRVNAKPTATVALSPSSPTTTTTLTATATKGDADAGDTVTLTYVWKADGATVKTTSGSASLSDTLDLSLAGNGDKGQTVSVEVTPNDGFENGSTATDSQTVANSAPAMTSATIDQASPQTNDTLTVTVASSDADGDARTYAYQWRKDGVDIAGATAAALDLSVAGNGNKGEGISVRVTASDGTASSAPLTSAAVTIANSVPVVDSVSIDQAAPGTDDTLSLTIAAHDADPGDTVMYAYAWTRNGVDIPGETASTLSLATAGNGDRGDLVRARVTASDGTASSAPLTSGPVTVANSAPTIASVTIDGAAPQTEDTLSVTVVSADADGDPRTYAYQWRRNGVDIPGATAATLDLSAAGNGDKGDAISVRVTASDGTASSSPSTSPPVTVANTAPVVVSVTIDQASPGTDDGLTVTVVATDPDAGDVLAYAYQWAVDGVDRFGETAATYDLSPLGNGDKGDAITVRVVADDGTASSAPVTSGARTVANSAPVLAAVAIDQAAPTTDDTLTATVTASDADGDALTTTYQWRRNGVDLSGETAGTLDLSNPGNGDKGDAVTLRVSVSDGTDGDGPVTSSAVTVANSAPTIASVTIDGAAPRTDDTLSVTVVSADADGDARTYAYQWRRNGVDLAGETGSTLDLSTPGNGDKGDAITVRVVADDGTASSAPVTSGARTVANSAPVLAAVAIDQAAPTTAATVTATIGASDPDGDTVTTSRQWLRNGVDLAGETGATLDLSLPGNGDKGDAIGVRVTVTDGTDGDGPVTSAAVTVANSAPTISSVTIDQGSPRTDDTLTVTVASADDDGDPRTYAYEWRVDGSPLAGETGSTLDLAVAGNGDRGDAVEVRVTASDGTASSAPVASAAETVENSAPTCSDTALATTQETPADTAPVCADADAGDTLTPSIVAQGTKGVASVVAGQLRYVPDAGVQGADSFAYRASDGTDASAAATVAVTVDDVTAPETAIDSGPAEGSTRSSTGATFAFSSDDPPSTFECRLDGGAWSTCTSPHALAGLGEGAHSFEVRATDDAGNTDATPAARAWTVDSVAPETSLDGAPADPSADATPTFAFSSEPGATFEVRVDAGAWTAATSPYTTAALDDGPHAFAVRATDAAGNVDATPAGHAWTVDTAAPETTIDTAPGDPSGEETPTFAFSASEGGSTFECRLDGGAWSACASPHTTASLGDGAHTFAVRATDAAGNVDATPAGHVWTLDAGAPSLAIVAPGAYVAAADADPYALTATTPDADVTQVEFLACSNAGCSGGTETSLGVDADGAPWTVSAPVPADGRWTIKAVASDGAANTGQAVVDATVDRTAPAGGSIAYADGWSAGGTVAVALDGGTDAGSGLDPGSAVVERDSAPLTLGSCGPFSGSWTPVTVPDAPASGACYAYRYRIADLAGNEVVYTSASVARRDATPPSAPALAFSAFANAAVNGGVLWFRPGAAGGFTVTPGAADAESGIAAYSHPNLGDGWSRTGLAWSFTAAAADPVEPNVVTATNGAGTTGPGTSFTVDADATPPATTASASPAPGAGGWHTSVPVAVTLSATDAESGVAEIRYTTDGSDPSAVHGTVYGAPIAVTGTTTVKFRAVDAVGNEEAVGSLLVRVDVTAPTTPNLAFSSPTNASVSGGVVYYRPTAAGGFTVTHDAADPESGLGATSYPPLGAGWTESGGVYAFAAGAADPVEPNEVTVANGAGLVSAGAPITVTADPAAPVTTATATPVDGANGWHVSQPVTVTLAAGDALSGVRETRWSTDGSAPSTPYAGPLSLAAEGATAVRFASEDEVGNVEAAGSLVVRIDTVAPTASLAALPAFTTGTVTLASTSADATSGVDTVAYEFRATGAPAWTPTPAAWDAGALPNGSYEVRAVVTDLAGNATATAAGTTVVDTTPPSVTLDPPGSPASGTVLLTATATDAHSGLATVEYEVSPAGAATWSATAASWDTTALADGAYDLRARATDNAGNVSAWSQVSGIQVDNDAPAVTLTSPLDGSFVNAASPDPRTVTATADDGAGAGVASVAFYEWTGAAWSLLDTDATAPYEAAWTLPADGTRRVKAVATDGAGHAAESEARVTVDRTPPVPGIGDPGADVRGTIALTGAAADGTSGVNSVDFQRSPAGADTWTTIASDGDGSDGWSASFDTTLGLASGASDGLYDVRVFVTDAAGNAAIALVTGMRIDNTAPTAGLTDPGANLRGTVSLAGAAADAGSGVAAVAFQLAPAGTGAWATIASDGDGSDGWSASFDTTLGLVPGTSDGLYDLRVLVTDRAGNEEEHVLAGRRIDNTAPTAALTDPGANLRGTVTLAGAAADAGSGVATVAFERRPSGGGAWTTVATDADGSNGWSADFDTTAAADGLHDLRVLVTDVAGNTGTAVVASRRVDNTAPTAGIDDPGPYIRATVLLTGSAGDPGGSGVVSVQFQRGPSGGGGPWSAVGAPDTDGGDGWSAFLDTTALPDGLYDLRVLVTDAAGNTATDAVGGRMVDNTAPTTTDDAPTSSASPVTVTLSASDAGSGPSATQFRLDGGAWQSGTSLTIPAPADHSNDGLHTIEYYSTDAAGNVEPVRSADVLIDTVGPTGTVGDPDDYLRGLVRLSAAPDDPGDVASVRFEYAPAGTSAWAPIGGLVLTAPYEVDWDTTAVADGAYDLQVTLTDALGNESVSSLPGKTVDNTAPTGSVTAPPAGAVRSGDVALAATAADAGSGVAAVEFFVRPAGAASFSSAGTDAFGPTYSVTWDSTAAADGPVDVQAVVRDVAGNEATTAVRTFTADNDPPDVTASAPGGAVSGTVTLSATGSADVAQVQFLVDGAPVGTDADGSDGWSAAWTTTGDGTRQVTARATDVGGNVRTSAPVAVLVDNTAPTGTMTSPTAGATVGGPAVPLAATASDGGGSGVASTTFQFKPAGGATWTDVPGATWDATPQPTGAYDLRAKVTDGAGNVGYSPAITVQADSTAPTVVLASPGAAISGVVTLTATASGADAQRVVFERSPAGAGTWTAIATDTAAPWSAAFDTTTVGDGDYDLRATVHDSFGNANEHRRDGIRVDNTSPFVVSSTPADGATLATAPAQVDVVASEALDAVTGLTLDGAPAVATGLPGSAFSVALGTLAAGPHVLAGTLRDRGGRTQAFRVHITVLGGGGPLPYVEANGSATATVSLTSPDGATRLVIPPGTFSPGGADWIVYRIRPVPAASVVASSAGPPTSIVDVTARWAIAGTEVHTFPVPLDLVLLNASPSAVVPVTLEGSTWRVLGPVAGALPAGREDGFHRAADGIHVLTRHLSLFGLIADVEPPTPPSAVGVVDADGLKLRWVPGTDAGGPVGQVKLYVNGAGFAHFDPTQTEELMGPWTAADTRAFQFSQFDLAGNESALTRPLRGVPAVVGLTLAQARAALAERGFSVGRVSEVPREDAAAGTVVEPRALALAEEGAAIDLVVAGEAAAPPPRLTLTVVGTKTYTPRAGRAGTVALRVRSSLPARATARLLGPRGGPIAAWRFRVGAGATVRRLRVPKRVTRPGVYRIVVTATADGRTARATVRLRVAKSLRREAVPAGRPGEVVLASRADAARAVALRLGSGKRVLRAGEERAFALTGAWRRNVRVVVVDVDAYGLRFVRDLHVVFPDVRIVALAGRKTVRAQALKSGAAVALPRSTPAARLARVVARAVR